MIEIQIKLNIRPDKMDEVMSLLYEDRKTSMSSDVFSEFTPLKISIRTADETSTKLPVTV
jgi:hypothetical protein